MSKNEATIQEESNQSSTLTSWKRFLIIPYSNILSRCFLNLLDEGYVKTKDGVVDFSKTRTIEISLRILAAEYIRELLEKWSFRIEGSKPIYPIVFIISSGNGNSSLDSSTWKISEEAAQSIKIDPIRLQYFAEELLSDLISYHNDVTSVLEGMHVYYDVIAVDQRYSYVKKILSSHFIPESAFAELEGGKFIIDGIDHPVKPGGVEDFRIETLNSNHILYRAIESKFGR